MKCSIFTEQLYMMKVSQCNYYIKCFMYTSMEQKLNNITTICIKTKYKTLQSETKTSNFNYEDISRPKPSLRHNKPRLRSQILVNKTFQDQDYRPRHNITVNYIQFKHDITYTTITAALRIIICCRTVVQLHTVHWNKSNHTIRAQ
jgi:hypothetical protein